ncbi:MAG: hypothetical protein WKF97_18465 [Chitinophagaceae bacterium]
MKGLRNGIAAFLCICLAGVPLFFSIWFLISQQSVRSAMEQKMEQEYLQTIVVLKSDVHWVKPGKEIRVQGSMFDVKSKRQKGDSIYFTGLFDADEDVLYSQLKNATDEFGDEQSSKLYAQTLLLVLIELDLRRILPVVFDGESKQYGSYSAFMPSISPARHWPPPKC